MKGFRSAEDEADMEYIQEKLDHMIKTNKIGPLLGNGPPRRKPPVEDRKTEEAAANASK